MKVVILAGGFGTRLSEETNLIPKPMVEIGGKPILWHIMNIYSRYGFMDFVICLGYKGHVIKEYFDNYFLHMSDVTFELSSNKMHVHRNYCEPWRVTLVDTGVNTMTGGRLKRVLPHLDEDEPFFFTYGDGLADINIQELLAFHKQQGLLATVTAVQAPGRFGAIGISNSHVTRFQEKPLGDGTWINGGFFVLSRKVVDYIQGDETVWEREPLENLAVGGQLAAYQHRGFWQAMDTLRDKQKLEGFCASGKPPW